MFSNNVTPEFVEYPIFFLPLTTIILNYIVTFVFFFNCVILQKSNHRGSRLMRFTITKSECFKKRLESLIYRHCFMSSLLGWVRGVCFNQSFAQGVFLFKYWSGKTEQYKIHNLLLRHENCHVKSNTLRWLDGIKKIQLPIGDSKLKGKGKCPKLLHQWLWKICSSCRTLKYSNNTNPDQSVGSLLSRWYPSSYSIFFSWNVNEKHPWRLIVYSFLATQCCLAGP